MRKDTPSRTAQVVALGTLCVAFDPAHRGLVPRETREGFLRTLRSAGLGWAAQSMRLGAVRKYAKERADEIVPGILVHYALRKRAVSEAVAKFLSEGIEQVVVLGGGLDPLGLRIFDERGVPVWEVDCSSNTESKRALAKGTGIRFVNFDMTDPCLVPNLVEHGLTASKRTLIVAEGVFMYLQRGVVENILASFRREGNAFVFTMIDLTPEGFPGFHSDDGLTEWLAKVDEPFVFGLHPRDVPDCLEEHGWTLVELLEQEDLCDRYAPSCKSQSAKGEYVVVASC